MTVSASLKNYLDENNYHYEMLAHVETETALENARVLNWPRNRVAKVIACEADNEPTLLVLPANERIHVRTLQDSTGHSHIHLLTEAELEERFPSCEVGAQTPFASLYGMKLIVSEHFDDSSEIVFNAENHHEAIKIPMMELIKTEKPKKADFSIDTADYDEYRSMYYTWI